MPTIIPKQSYFILLLTQRTKSDSFMNLINYVVRTWTALIIWRDIDKVYQHSDTMLLYFLLMDILSITGILEHIALILTVINMFFH